MKLLPPFIHRRIENRPELLRVVGNIGWLVFDKVLRLGLGLYVAICIARYLGPEYFGKLNFAIAFVGLFGALATLGLQAIVVRDLVRDHANRLQTLGTSTVLLMMAGAIAYILIIRGIILLRPEDPTLKSLVAVLGLLMTFKASEIAVYWFESQVKSKFTVWVSNSIFVLFAAVKLLLIWFDAPLIAFAWAMIGEAGLTAVLMLLVMHLRGPSIQLLTASVHRARLLLRDSWPMLLSGVAILIYMKIDQIMLGQMVGDKAVGIYSVAIQVSEAWYFLPTVVVASIFPSILELREQSEALYLARFQYLYDVLIWVAIVVALPITLVSDGIIQVLFGEAYVDAGPVLAVHIWSGIFVVLGVASNRWLVAESRQILSLQRTALGAVINVGCNAVLIPRFGPEGAAWATLVSYAVAAMFFDIAQAETRSMFAMKLRAFNLMRSTRQTMNWWRLS